MVRRGTTTESEDAAAVRGQVAGGWNSLCEGVERRKEGGVWCEPGVEPLQEPAPARGGLWTEQDMIMGGSGNGNSSGNVFPPGGAPAVPAANGAAVGPLRRVVRITNPHGLHHRAADRFSRVARRFLCRVTLYNGTEAADGKNIWDLLSLAVLPEQEVVLETEGPDAATALEELAAVLGDPNGEDYTI